MSISTQEQRQPARRGWKGRPIAWLIATAVGLGGFGLAAGMALGTVGATSGSPSPASAGYDCPRGAFGGDAR